MIFLDFRTYFAAVVLSASLVGAAPWVLAADCNGNGVQDRRDIANGGSDDCNSNAVPDECEFAPLVFGFGQTFRVPRIPRVAVAADFNGDGISDLATGNHNPNTRSTVSLLLSRGDETFEVAAELDVGEGLSSLTAADFDQDGDVDLATANFAAVFVLENQGDGSFSILSEIAAVESSKSLSAVDVNSDGFPDLLTTREEMDTVVVRHNRLDGTFDEPIPFTVGSEPSAVAPTDVNGDGHADLVVANSGSASVSLLIGAGDGTFADPVHVDVAIKQPFSVASVDLDGDGDLDLAVAGSAAVAVHLNDGSGVYGAPSSYGASPTSFTSGDVDADGDVDLVYGSFRSGIVSVLVNDGTGRFSPTNFGLPGARWAIVAADFNGNGKIDLAVSVVNPDRMALLWNGIGAAGAGISSLSFSDPMTFPAAGEPHGAVPGDIDGDGIDDVIIANNQFGLAILISNGDGTFPAPRIYKPGPNSFSVVAVDLDGDKDLDIASVGEAEDFLWILRNTGAGELDEGERYDVPGRTFHITDGDLDGDGDLDLVISMVDTNALALFYNDGDANFEHVGRRLPRDAIASTVADFDGDGDADIAFVTETLLSILDNEGDRTFADPVQLIGPRPLFFVDAADLDGDGHVDLATTNGARRVSVYWNTGDGSFESAASPRVNGGPSTLFIAEVSGDERLDLILALPGSRAVSVLRNQGGRFFADPLHLSAGIDSRWVVAADVDSDGVNDLVSANHGIGIGAGSVTVLLNETDLSADKYREQICTDLDFHRVSVAAARDPTQRATKFIVPARDDPALVVPALIQDVERFPFHEEFLAEAFPDVFGGLTAEGYTLLVGRRESRDYYVGVVTRWPLQGPLQGPLQAGFRYSFTVVADTGFHPGEALNLEEIQRVYSSLSEVFELAPLFYAPDTELARREVEENWPDPSPIPVDMGEGRSEFAYEAYSLGVGFGRIRLFTLEEFEEENDEGRFTFQDILVVADAPRDIEGVVGGFFTGRVQGELSHTAIRLARQGTPNAFVADAVEVFSKYDGKLVRVEVCEGGYSIDDSVTPAQAEEFWIANRPTLPVLPLADREYAEFDGLSELDLSGANGFPPEARFGGKASNLARLQRLLDGKFTKYREPGFAIPMRYYLEFMATNSLEVGGRTVTYADYIEELLETLEFQTDSAARASALRDFRRLVRRDGVVDANLVERLTQRIAEVFGSTNRMVRFRSSSNVEDALEFNGAGLYDSTSACAADTLDPELLAGSHCDPMRDNERTIERALKRVWSSLWTFRAFEERAYYQIPQESAAMGLLVNRAFLDEIVNGVAFTGNPGDPDDSRYLVTSQVGEASVVSPDPGTTVERNFLTVVDGQVVEIVRDRSSSLLLPGETVLSDEQLRELGAFMWHVDANFPIALQGHARKDVLMDFEFKFEPDGSLAVKQVRPFLLPTATIKSPTFKLEIPEHTTVCGIFPTTRPGRGPRVEYETKSVVRFLAGTIELPTASDSFEGELFDEVLFGPQQQSATPTGPGRFQVTRVSGDCNETAYRFGFEQSFTIPGVERFSLRLFNLEFTAQRDTPLGDLRFDEEYLTFSLLMRGEVDGAPTVDYESCSYELLPLWSVTAEFEGGSLSLLERFEPSKNNLATGPAALVRANVVLRGQQRMVTDYWQLVYDARRHNRNVRYWVILDPPLELPGVDAPIHAVELVAPEARGEVPAGVSYLGENFEVLAQPRMRDFQKGGVVDAFHFRRGDIDTNGTVNVTDAVVLARGLFRRDSVLPCEKSADVTDDGRLTVSDAVRLLIHLFRDPNALAQPLDCGIDPTTDGLTCESFLSCP